MLKSSYEQLIRKGVAYAKTNKDVYSRLIYSLRHLFYAWDKESSIVYHDEYLRLSSESKARCHAYRELFKQQLSEHDIHQIKKAEKYCHPIGDERFKKSIEEKYDIKLGQMSRGRPRKKSDG